MITSYDFYTGIYGGEMVEDEARFVTLERRALLYFNRLTFDRLSKGWQVTDAVEMTICQLVDLEEEKNRRANGVGAGILASESVDGYSVSYRDQTNMVAEYEKRTYNIMHSNLAHTGIMDRSINNGRWI